MVTTRIRSHHRNNSRLILFLVVFVICDPKIYSCYALNNNTSCDIRPMKCNPQSRHLFGNFLMQCWSNARKEVGLSDPFILKNQASDEERVLFKSAANAVVMKFFNHNTGTVIYYKHWQAIPYVRLYNSGEDAITYILEALSRPSYTQLENNQLPLPIRQTAKLQSQLNLSVSALQQSHVVNKCNHDHPSAFTIVSDPLTKFSAGYQESITRGRSRNIITTNVNSTMAKKHIDLLLDYEQPVPATYQNLYPMCGAFFDFFIDTVGQNEHLSVDWVQIICETYPFICKPPASLPPSKDYEVKTIISKRTGKKKSIVVLKERPPPEDRYGAMAALQELFASEPRYLRALCHLLLVDYVCLPMYVLPSPCQFLNATRRAAESALDQGKELPYVVSEI